MACGFGCAWSWWEDWGACDVHLEGGPLRISRALLVPRRTTRTASRVPGLLPRDVRVPHAHLLPLVGDAQAWQHEGEHVHVVHQVLSKPRSDPSHIVATRHPVGFDISRHPRDPREHLLGKMFALLSNVHTRSSEPLF